MKKENISKMWIADLGDGNYRNPILYTDYSDPDVIRVNEDYYMVASSFCNSPAVPVLHSKDLVNWKMINYVMDRLPFDKYDTPQHGCGSFAPSIRYHDGIYYVFTPIPDEGIMVSTTANPWEKWNEPYMLKANVGWIDPCPFWDDDGSIYMVNAFARSRIGFNSVLYLSVLEQKGDKLVENPHKGGFVYNGRETQPVIEGPKLHKRNGYYYIFAPAGSVTEGWQTVLRAKDIMGPYEEKIVLHQGTTDINGPHQGAWVDTPDGEDWFIHFQDVGTAGRIVHLQPMRWVDDWPVIGTNVDENGCGEPVSVYKKPQVNQTYPADAPEDSDFFDGDRLGLQWQWNANYKEEWYELADGYLHLHAQRTSKMCPVCDVSNLLLQKWPAPEFTITTCMELNGMKDNDAYGLLSFGRKYDGLFVCQKQGQRFLQQRIGEIWQDGETHTTLEEIKGDKIFLRMKVEKASRVSWEFGTEEGVYRNVGKSTEAKVGVWVGVKAGLVAINDGETECGTVKISYFVFQPLGQ